ncbi:MAG: hypothetical protein H8D23_10695 [Candidatus Brocadiales bacterium]|nr:hypothetical protein [Candidatus Brocadiales bacterium]
MSNLSLSGVLTKQANKQEIWTVEEAKEFAKCADPKTGPRYFLTNYFYIQHPIHGKLKYAPYPFQDELIDTYHNYRFNINMMPRQTGKCLFEKINIRIKHKDTGEELEISVGDFFEMQKNNSRE